MKADYWAPNGHLVPDQRFSFFFAVGFDGDETKLNHTGTNSTGGDGNPNRCCVLHGLFEMPYERWILGRVDLSELFGPESFE